MMWPFRSYVKFADMDFRTDVHSHILPGVDDGFRTGQDSGKALGLLHDMGVEHCILTPHVYPELYPANNPSSIRNRFSEVSDMLVRTGVECRVAGEHMVYAGVDSGFSEENAEGKALEKQIVDTVNSVNGALIGPNCIGVLTTHYNGVFTTPIPKLDPKGVDLVSGSGATALFIMDAGMQKGVKFSSVFSVGNSAQLGVEEILEYEKVPPAFVLNVDESGFQEFSDSGKQIVYVPKTYEGTETYFSVNRSAKRNTMIGCIGMDGSALIPLIVTPYKTVQRTLLLQGYGPDKCVLVQQDAGFVTSQIFAFWADHVLFPYVLQKRKLHGYEGTVILFLDGCSAHFSDYFMDECTYYGIYPIKEPPGTSDQIQQLDLGIFGIQKALQTKHIKGDYRANDKAIIEIVNSWRKATTPDNVVSAFHQSGLYVNSTSECEGYVCADISKARAVRGIQHMPCHDVIVGRQSVQIVSMN